MTDSSTQQAYAGDNSNTAQPPPILGKYEWYVYYA